jgi:RNA polymerase sigma factor (sigma-70 family)
LNPVSFHSKLLGLEDESTVAKQTTSAAVNGRVFIVDDDPSVRKGLTRLLGSHGLDVEVFPCACEFLKAQSERPWPSCILLDVKMPHMDGLELQQELDKRGFCMPIVFLTGHGDIPTSVRAIKEGAVDFLTKPVDEKDLLDAIREALAKDKEQYTQQSEKEKVLDCVHELTVREREVLRHVIAGRLNKQIARSLGIAEKTVKVHRGRVMEKMAADSVAVLVRLAEKAGIEPAATGSSGSEG